jgi:hypothetical protein
MDEERATGQRVELRRPVEGPHEMHAVRNSQFACKRGDRAFVAVRRTRKDQVGTKPPGPGDSIGPHKPVDALDRVDAAEEEEVGPRRDAGHRPGGRRRSGTPGSMHVDAVEHHVSLDTRERGAFLAAGDQDPSRMPNGIAEQEEVGPLLQPGL